MKQYIDQLMFICVCYHHNHLMCDRLGSDCYLFEWCVCSNYFMLYFVYLLNVLFHLSIYRFPLSFSH